MMLRVAYLLAALMLLVGAEQSLTILHEFAVPYRDFDTAGPVMSMSQQFSDLGANTWVETAVPLPVANERQWDVRAIRFDVAIGRRPAGSTGIFNFAWDGERVLRMFGGRLHLYKSCPSASHAIGKPCPEPVGIYNARLINQSLEIAFQDSWGKTYRADVFLSRDPSVPGFVAQGRMWVSFFATMPSHHKDEVDGKTYELRHWFPVAASRSEETDLAIADHGDMLQRGWTDWRHGQDLRNSLYQGTAYPSPGFSVIGYDSELTSPVPTPSAPVNDTHHWPSGIPPGVESPSAQTPSGSSGRDLAIVISVSAGILLLLFALAALVINGLIRRRKRNLLAKQRDNEILHKLGNEHSQLIINDEGTFGTSRPSTAYSTGAPMLSEDYEDDDNNNPYGDRVPPRGRLTSIDDDEDDFE